MKRPGSEPAAAAVTPCAKLQVCRRLLRLTEQNCRFVIVCLG